MSKKYEIGMKVAMGTYGGDTLEEDKHFDVDDELVLIEEDEETTTADNPSFLAKRVSDDTQGYVFASELGDPVAASAETPTEGKKLKVRKGKAAAAKAPAKAAAKAPAKGKTKAAAAKPAAKGKAQAKAKPKAKAKPAPKKQEPPKLKHATSVMKLVKSGGTAALKAARDVAGRIASDFYVLGGLLTEIKEKAFYEVLVDGEGQKMIGQPGFETYIRQELGIEYRIAMHFMAIYEVTRRAGIAESKVKGLKYTKILPLLRLLSQGAITKETWDEWAEKAKELKGAAYKEAVEQAYVDANITKMKSRGATANQVRFMFVLFDDRAEVMNKALALAKSELPPAEDGEEHTNSEAIDLIVSEWLSAKAQG